MKSLCFFLVIIVLFLSSCSRYQYAYLNGNLPKNDQKEFVQENDTCIVKYSFSGQNCPMTINIFNKLSIPLYVDWKRSAVILNNENVSLWDDQFSSTVGNNVSFVPPQSSTQLTPLNLITEFVKFLPEDRVAKVKFMTNNGLISYKRHYYYMNNSPFYFTCLLYYSTKEDFSSETNTNNYFWISDVIPSFSELLINEPDNFYLQKSTGFSTVMGVTALAGLIYLGALLPDEEVE